MGNRLDRVRQEWRQNARLRWGALAIMLILGVRLGLWVSDERAELAKQYARDAELFARLDATARETAWPRRAKAAEVARDQLIGGLREARNDGAARADLQAWLGSLAADAVLTEPSIQVEAVLDVPGYPELRQAVARVEGTVPTHLDVAPFVRGLAAGLPWIQAEQFEVGDGQPVKVLAIVRAYYRKPSLVPPAAPAAPAAVAPSAAPEDGR